jgi:hypothetical protein
LTQNSIFIEGGDIMFGFATAITIKTLWYSLLWLCMMIIGGACYEQRFYAKKHNGKKM